METKTITAPIAWRSSEPSETPTQVEILIDHADKEKIKLCKKLIKEHKLTCIKIEVDRGDFIYEGEPDEIVDTDWRTDTETLNITSYGIYYYAQGKRDAGDQIESEDISSLIFTKEELGAINENR